MLLKLPIISENKVIFTLFRIIKYDNYFMVNTCNNENDNLIKIMICNIFTGYEIINLYFPLKITIIDNYVICNLFFYVIYSINNELDFFYHLKKCFSDKFNYTFISLKNIKSIVDYINKEYLLTIQNTNILRNYWDTTQLVLNFSVYNIWLTINHPTFKIKIIKKLQFYFNIIKNVKFNIDYSDNYNICEHLDNLLKINVELDQIKINNNYYIFRNNKFFFVNVINIYNNIIEINNKSMIDYNNYIWYYYNIDINITDDKIYFIFLNNSDIIKTILQNIIPTFISNNISKLFKYYTTEKYDYNIIYLLKKNELDILKTCEYTNIYFVELCSIYPNFILILNILFENFSYPMKYNKKELHPIFDRIIYLSLLNIDKLSYIDKNKLTFINIAIPNKIKTIYFNIIKIFYYLINKNKNTIKYISDSLYFHIIKLFLSTDNLTINLLCKIIPQKELTEFKNELLIYLVIIDCLNKLKWTNINKKLEYIKYIYDNNSLLMFNDKTNKNIFPLNFDIKLKNILINPFEMFKYIHNKDDFIKWVWFLENKITMIFYNPISLSSFDLECIGYLIFYLVNIKIQNIDDINYRIFIDFCNKYPKLIIDDKQINIKIKEIFTFLKCNINLGLLHKHLIQSNNIIDLTINNKITDDINIITKKYLKYKKKYFFIKKKLIS